MGLFNRRLINLYKINALKKFIVFSMNIVIPIYVMLNYSMKDAIFYLFFSTGVFYIVGLFLTLKLLKLGLERVMIISIFLSLFSFVSIFLIKGWVAIILSSFFAGFSRTTFWTPYHAFFPLLGRKKKMVIEVSNVQLINYIISILTPIIVSIIAEELNYLLSVLIPVVIATIIAIYFFFTIRSENHVGRKAMFKTKFYLAFLFEGASIPVLLHLYIFSVLGKLITYGSLNTITNFLLVVSTYLLHFPLDRKGKFFILLPLSLLPYLTFPLFSIKEAIIPIYLIFNLFYFEFSSAYISVVYKFCTPLEASFTREFYIGIGRTLSILPVLLLNNFKIYFAIVAISGILRAYFLLRETNSNRKFLTRHL